MIRFAILVTLLMTMIDYAFAQGDAPPFTQGQDATTKNVSTVIKVPAKQSTKISGSQSLLETGNKNRLENPSFEHSTFDTGWTSSVTGGAVATVAVYTTNPKDGAKAVQLTCSTGVSGVAGTCSFKQEFTHNTYLSGVQGLASIWAATTGTTDSTAKVYALVNGSRSSQSVSIATQASISGYGHYQVPWIMGSTSFGIDVVLDLAANRSMDVFLDDAFAGPQELKIDSDDSKIAGYSYFAATANCTWARSSTAMGAFTADTDCPGPTISYSSMGEWQTTDSDLPRQTINNLPPGVYKATFTGVAMYNTTSAANAVTITDGTTTCVSQQASPQASAEPAVTVSCVFKYTEAGNRSFELYGSAASSTINIDNTNPTGSSKNSKFILEYFGDGSTYSASCGANCVDTFSAKVSSTAVISDENIDWITAASYSSGDTTLTLKSGVFTVAPNCTATTSGASGTHASITSVSTSSVVIRTKTSSTAADGQFAFHIDCQKTGADFTATRTIVGSFSEVVTAPGISRPKTCYYAFGGASATLASPTECTSGTCTEVYDTCGTGTAPTWATVSTYNNLTFAAGTWANSTPLWCDCIAYDATAGATRKCHTWFDTGDTTWATTSSGGAILNILSTDQSGTSQTSVIQVKCEGQAP